LMVLQSEVFERLGIHPVNGRGTAGELRSINPNDGAELARVRKMTRQEYDSVVDRAAEVFAAWRYVPAPQRGLVIRAIGDELRTFKAELGTLITLEMGKILAEGHGEVQEMIDIADFAVGLSRQLCGSTMHSERPGHRMYEQWHPLGPVGVMSAFNFPVAVWAWNAMLAGVCGDTVVWKPSPRTPLTAFAVQNICDRVFERFGHPGVFQLVTGDDSEIGSAMLDDSRLPLISFTGSTRVGRQAAERVARRLGRTILELGGNNALIVMDDADEELALRAIVFGALGTAGQRCTSTRRVFLQRGIAGRLTARLKAAYEQVQLGNPAEPSTLMGPLISEEAVAHMVSSIDHARSFGAEVVFGGNALGGCFAEPTLLRVSQGMPLLQEELFAPVLYLVEFDTLEEAIDLQNNVSQGLSSALFTRNLQHAELFLSCGGSDCGIANVNLGTSGAEIGGAFGGEKDTGGGRESGSDSWKAYMRRQTNTINWSKTLPLAQGIDFAL
jgi:aldehyde dehydrogenase (NAD+)